MNNSAIIFFNAISIFPLILTSSSMKLILGQSFHTSLKYSTIVSYAGIIGIFKFLFVKFVQQNNLSFLPLNNLSNYKKWALLGSMMMTFFLIIIYLTLWWNPFANNEYLALTITLLSTFILLGDIITDTAMSIFYSNFNEHKSLSSSIFLGHKMAAFLGYFLFPMIVEYIGFHISFITFIIISFLLNFTVFYLPEVNIENYPKNSNILSTIYTDLTQIKNISLIILFILTCQMGSLIINGMKCNFIAQVTHKKLLSYLLRGLGLVVGTVGGYSTNFLRKILGPDESHQKTFITGGILQTIAIIINFIAFSKEKSLLFIIATVFENINKGFMMAALTKFFLIQSNKKPHILTFFWGLFSVLRSIYGGMSGYLISSLGVKKFFIILIITSFIPIIIPMFLKRNN